FWRGLTTRGALVGGSLGLVSAVVLTLLSPGVWTATLGLDQVFGIAAPFPYATPALFSTVLAFAATWLFSVTDGSETARRERAAFEAQFVRSATGIGAAGAAAH